MKRRMLKKLYECVLENLTPNPEYRELRRKFNEEREIFLQNIEKQDSKTLEELIGILYDANNKFNEQVFCKGFLMGLALLREVTDEDIKGY